MTHLLSFFTQWVNVLQADKCALSLSASKTIIYSRTAMILRWTWCLDTISASSHRISTLATCSQPTNVHGMQSFHGAYKVLSRVISECSHILASLENAVAGGESQENIERSNELHEVLFQQVLLVLPRPDDQLVVTDGAVKSHDIGAIMYVTRGGEPILAGYFSVQLRGRQVTWLPCEIEALSIAVATKHFSPYIIQSRHKVCILTDNKPYVQAFEEGCWVCRHTYLALAGIKQRCDI